MHLSKKLVVVVAMSDVVELTGRAQVRTGSPNHNGGILFARVAAMRWTTAASWPPALLKAVPFLPKMVE